MMHWIFDFDDTLVVGPNTWAIEVALPAFIQEHQLPYDQNHFMAVLLEAQRQAAQNKNEDELLNYVFASLNWSNELKLQLVERVFNQYVPSLFSDTTSFLDELKAANHNLSIISNNNHAPMLAEKFGIRDYFEAIYTPKAAHTPPKPHLAMWDIWQQNHMNSHILEIQFVGDDPWSDGTFALGCGVTCWIVDRLARYQTLHSSMPFHWVASLADIQFEGSDS